MPKKPKDLSGSYELLRRIAIKALVSDDKLLAQLVLKGGNALGVLLGDSPRASLDLDFSIDGDFPDPEETESRIGVVIENGFRKAGYQTLDFRFKSRPETSGFGVFPKFWGGYEIAFKVIDQIKIAPGMTVEDLRRHSEPIEPGGRKTLSIDLSKYEYCKAKSLVAIDDCHVYVYTADALVAEKLRALCQQMPQYRWIPEKQHHPRPRDVFDIYTIISRTNLDVSSEDFSGLTVRVFASKDVPIEFLRRLESTKSFHASGWDSVVPTVKVDLKPFEFYFEFVLQRVRTLRVLSE